MVLDSVERKAASATFAVLNPATREEVASVRDVGVEGAEQAIEVAHQTFPSWAGTPAELRSNVLQKAAHLVRERIDDLARTMTLESGKPLAESRGELLGSAGFFQWSGEEARRVYGRTVPPSLPDRRYLVTKQPVGVVAAITPWNFPSAMVARKAGPALAAGCTVVLRPASATPLSALALADVLRDAGLPEGTLNVITTKNSAPIGELFATHHLVRKLTFTGSTEVGKHLMKLAAELCGFLEVEDRDPDAFPNILYHNINIGTDRQTSLAESQRFLDAYYAPGIFSDSMTAAWTAAGSPQECIEHLRELVSDGARGISLRLTSWKQREQYDRLVNEVLPYVNKETNCV